MIVMKKFIKITEADGNVYAINTDRIDHMYMDETYIKIWTANGTNFTANAWNNDLKTILNDLEIN